MSAQANSLYDYSGFAALYQPCISATAFNTSNAHRCNSLLAKGLLTGAAPAADLPLLAANPAAADAIKVTGTTVNVPD